MSDTERINFPDGSWWDIRTIVTRRMRKAFHKAGREAFARDLHLNGNDSPDDLKRLAMANMEHWDLDSVDDAYLIEGTYAWSMTPPITSSIIDSLPDEVVNKVLVRMREIYAEAQEEVIKN